MCDFIFGMELQDTEALYWQLHGGFITAGLLCIFNFPINDLPLLLQFKLKCSLHMVKQYIIIVKMFGQTNISKNLTQYVGFLFFFLKIQEKQRRQEEQKKRHLEAAALLSERNADGCVDERSQAMSWCSRALLQADQHSLLIRFGCSGNKHDDSVLDL